MTLLTKSQAETVLKAANDPLAPHDTQRLKKLSVGRVFNAATAVDARGFQEVLYRDVPGNCMTAYLNGNQLAYIADGW